MLSSACPQSAPRPLHVRVRRRGSLQRRAAATLQSDVPAKLPAGFEAWTAEQLASQLRGQGPPLPVYSPEALAAELSTQPLLLLGRVATVTSTLGNVAVALALDAASGSLGRNERARATQLRQALTSLGAAFVKLGQALSTRPDLLPGPYLAELSELQDGLPGFSDAEAFSLIEAELGSPLQSFFRSISPRPIAAASLGQVYRAELVDGTEVAVKVQRPGVGASLKLDIYLIRQLAVLLDANMKLTGLSTSVVEAVDTFSTKVYGETDYVSEGRSAERFSRLYSSATVLVPEVMWSATSSRVLTTQWIEGIKLSDSAELRKQNLDPLALVDIGIQCSLRQLLEAGYFHADPHPGNLLGTADGRLCFLDFGIMSETPPSARNAIIAHVVHLVNRDYTAMAEDYYALGFLPRTVDVRPIVPALEAFFDDVLSATVSELNFSTLVEGLGAILYAYPFTVPGYYALILRSLTVLEGLALTSDPDFKVLNAAYPFFARQLLASDAPALRSSLAEMVFQTNGGVRWGRLEGLVEQAARGGGGNSDGGLGMKDVLPALLDLVLGGEAEAKEGPPSATLLRLRGQAEAEAARCVEALIVGGGLDGWGAVSGTLSAFLPPTSIADAALPPAEREELLELRGTLQRISTLLLGGAQTGSEEQWEVVRGLLAQPRVRAFAQAVAGRVAQRALARAFLGLLTPPTSSGVGPAVPAIAR